MARNILSRQQYLILKNAEKRGVDMTPRQALEIARNQQRKNGNIVNDNLYLTSQGKAYSNLTSEERAIYRRARETGRMPYEYKIDNGRVVVKDEYRKRKKKSNFSM